MVSEISGIISIMKFFGTFIVMLWLTLYIQAGACAEILEEPKTQYVMIGKNAMFTCKTTGIEAFWVLNDISMTRSFPGQVQDYENKGVVFVGNSTQNNHNLTMTIPATMTLNNTEISCHAIRSDYTQAFSKKVYLVVVGSSDTKKNNETQPQSRTMESNDNIAGPKILEEPKSKYVMIGENATFSCKSTGKEAFWILNNISMTITYLNQMQFYEDNGVVFKKDSSDYHYNLTMIMPGIEVLNNTVISCLAINVDYVNTMSKEVDLVVVNTSENADS